MGDGTCRSYDPLGGLTGELRELIEAAPVRKYTASAKLPDLPGNLANLAKLCKSLGAAQGLSKLVFVC